MFFYMFNLGIIYVFFLVKLSLFVFLMRETIILPCFIFGVYSSVGSKATLTFFLDT